MNRIIALGVILTLCLSLTACLGSSASPQEIVSELCRKEAGLPSGQIYHSDAPEGSDEYLPKAMLTSYGIPPDYTEIEKSAIFLSGNGHPCEFAVFVCKDGRTTEDVSLFLKERIRSLERGATFASQFCDLSPDEYGRYISFASVTVSGRYVALIISSDPKEALRTFTRAA